MGRGFVGDIEHLAQLFGQGIKHKGFASIDVLQPWVSFNHKNTYDWCRQRIYKLEDEGYGPSDRSAAFMKAFELGDRIPIVVIYKVHGR